MNEALIEAFRHNSWATKQLLEFCRGLSEEQLRSPATGTFGGILATFSHIVRSDGAYLRRLAGSGPAWVDGDDSADLDQLEARVEETGQLWEQFLSEPVDAERVIIVDEGANEVRAGSSSHRRSITGMPTGNRSEPS